MPHPTLADLGHLQDLNERLASVPAGRWRVQRDDLSGRYLVLCNDPPSVIAEVHHEASARLIAEEHNHLRSLIDTSMLALGEEVHGWSSLGAMGLRRERGDLMARVLQHFDEGGKEGVTYSAMILRRLPDGAVQVLHHQPAKYNGTLAVCEANAWLNEQGGK
jgi:hypothetical protein